MSTRKPLADGPSWYRGTRRMTGNNMNYAEQAPTNAELGRGALAGDSESWDNLVRRHNGSLYGVARSFRLDQAAADDAVQEAWMRLVENLGTLRGPDRVGA